MFGTRIILGIAPDDNFYAIQTIGKIIRDKVYVYALGDIEPKDSFSAWRVIQFQQGEEWKDYDGFDIDKIQRNADDLKNDCEGCEGCDEDCEEDA